jgi:formyl-CoA transferase
MVRGWGPFDRGIGVYFLSVNRNKRSIAVDFRDPRGLAVIRDLLTAADVVVDNFKPGTMERMGLGDAALEALNPRLVRCSISGFGSEGPYGSRPGFDQVAQGMSGLMSITGAADGEGFRVGLPIGDLVGGMWGAIGIEGALLERARTGRGRRVETSLLSGLVGLLCVQGQRTLSLGEVPERVGNHHPVIAAYGTFSAADAPINVAAATEGMWRALCRVLDAPALADDPRFVDNAARMENRGALQAELDRRFRARPAAAWTEALIDAGIPAGPINTLDRVFSDPHVVENRYVETVEHPTLGALPQLASPVVLDGVRGASVRTPPPALGADTAAILEGLGYDAGRIAALGEAGVVGGALPARAG